MARVVWPGMEWKSMVINQRFWKGVEGGELSLGFKKHYSRYPGLPYTPAGQGTKLSLTPKSFGGSSTALRGQARERELRALPHSSQPFFPLC